MEDGLPFLPGSTTSVKKKGMRLELKGQWGEPPRLKWKFWCLEAEKGERSVQS